MCITGLYMMGKWIVFRRKIKELTAQRTESDKDRGNAEQFSKLIKGYAGIGELSAALLNTLIEKITIGEPQDADASTTVVLKDGRVIEESPNGSGHTLSDTDRDNAGFSFSARVLFAEPVLPDDIAEIHIQNLHGVGLVLSIYTFGIPLHHIQRLVRTA